MRLSAKRRLQSDGHARCAGILGGRRTDPQVSPEPRASGARVISKPVLLAVASGLLAPIAFAAGNSERSLPSAESASGSLALSHSDPNLGRFVALGGEVSDSRFNCAACHGVDGAGDASGAFPRLSD